MYARISLLRRSLLVALMSLTLAACGPASTPVSSVPTPSGAPSSSPSGSPAPSSAASAAPSATPSASAAPDRATEVAAGTDILPQPLLFIREGQIVRLERDAKTITPLTSEQPGQPDIMAVINFDVSPVDGSLVFVAQGREGNNLVRTNAQGQERTELLSNVSINHPRWSPDGSQIAFQNNGREAGVFLISANGGDLRYLQPNDPVDAVNPAPEARGYFPHAWSPDGKKLLLVAYALGVEVCSAAVKDIESGDLVPIQSPAGLVSGCASGQWSPDSRTIFIGMNRPGPQPPVPGLWQADPQTGAVTPFIVGEQGDGSYVLVTNQRPFEADGVYAFVANVKALPDPFGGVRVRYKLYEARQNDGAPLRDEEFPVVGQALWAPDNSGVVVDMPKGDTGDVITAWIPVNGDPVVELGPFMGEAKQWAYN